MFLIEKLYSKLKGRDEMAIEAVGNEIAQAIIVMSKNELTEFSNEAETRTVCQDIINSLINYWERQDPIFQSSTVETSFVKVFVEKQPLFYRMILQELIDLEKSNIHYYFRYFKDTCHRMYILKNNPVIVEAIKNTPEGESVMGILHKNTREFELVLTELLDYTSAQDALAYIDRQR